MLYTSLVICSLVSLIPDPSLDSCRDLIPTSTPVAVHDLYQASTLKHFPKLLLMDQPCSLPGLFTENCHELPPETGE